MVQVAKESIVLVEGGWCSGIEVKVEGIEINVEGGVALRIACVRVVVLLLL